MRVSATLVLVALLLACCSSPGNAVRAGVGRDQTMSFPRSWAGTWQGTCHTLSPGGKLVRSFPMALIVQPGQGSDRTGWTIIYGEGKRKQVRNYELIPVDPARGHWRIDEKNSIILDAWYLEDTLQQAFTLEGITLHVRFARRVDQLEVEMASYDQGHPRATGGEGRVPEVESFRLKVLQKGTLTQGN